MTEESDSRPLPLPPAIARAIRQIGAHPSVEGVEVAGDGDGGAVVNVIVRTELPAAWRAEGQSPFGVRILEPLVIRLPSLFPAGVPTVELRPDFDRGHPHINPGPADGPVRPCLLMGSIRELVQTRGIHGLMEQLVEWLEGAATLSLNNPSRGWEPVRRDSIADLLVCDGATARAIAAAKPKGGAAFSFTFFSQMTKGKPGYYVTWKPEQLPLSNDAVETMASYEKRGSLYGRGIAILAWPGRAGGKPVVADRYMPETVTEVVQLLERAAAYGVREAFESKLRFAARQLQRRPVAHPTTILVVLVARRPYHLVGMESDLELCPYLIEAPPGIDVLDDRTPVRPVGMRETLSPEVLRRAAGDPPGADRRPWTLVGCGSVGSKIALHCARSGYGPQMLIDRDVIEPHNHARHTTFPPSDISLFFFPGKADMLGEQLEALRQPATSCHLDAVGLTLGENGRKVLASSDTLTLVNTTGSVAVREALSHSKWPERPRMIETCLLGAGKLGYLALEGRGGNPSASDLIADGYRIIGADRDLAKIVFGAEAEAITIGQGCSSPTFAMPDERLSALAASLAVPIHRWVRDGLPEQAELRLGRVGADEISQGWESFTSAP